MAGLALLLNNNNQPDSERLAHENFRESVYPQASPPPGVPKNLGPGTRKPGAMAGL